MWQRKFGDDNPNTLKCQFSLATVYANQGRFDEAEKLFKKTYEAQRRLFGESDSNVVATQIKLGYVYYLQGRYAESKPLLHEVVGHIRKAPKQPSLDSHLTKLGIWASSQDNRRNLRWSLETQTTPKTPLTNPPQK